MVDVMPSPSSLSSGDSSSPVEEAELELGLGLGLPVGRSKERHRQSRIRSAQEKSSLFLSSSSATSASSSSNSSNVCATLPRSGYSSGTKRSADSVAVPAGHVGWPPVGNYRMNSMAIQNKSVPSKEFSPVADNGESKNMNQDMIINDESCKIRASPYVKVYMDGMPIGRKIDLSAQGCYETLAQALEEMFFDASRESSSHAQASLFPWNQSSSAADGSRRHFLTESAEFMLTYEDKDGDWMLVGDVPWGMFVSSVKRLKIMRAGEATGLGKIV